jgi:THO complex subunit 2
LEALSNPDNKGTNPDGTTISMWLTALSAFCGAILGIEASEEMTKEHMEAMQGGELLRAEVAHFGQVRVTKKAAQRLKETLLESNLAITLCHLIAKQRCKLSTCLENQETENNHLKVFLLQIFYI